MDRMTGYRLSFGFARQLCLLGWMLLSALFLAGRMFAADFTEARAKFYAGDYEQCIALAQAEVERGIRNDVWSRLLMEALMTKGRYEEALKVYQSVETIYPSSIPLRMLGVQAYRFSGLPEKGEKLLDEIPALVGNAPWRFSDRENMLALGKYSLAEGEDPRAVLDAFYDRTLKSDPRYVEAHLAIAELAIDKSDYQEAVKSLGTALKLRPEDPTIHYLLAKAWSPSDAEKATEFLQSAVDLNPNHPESLLMQAENSIDSEDYAEADRMLDRVLDINARHPDAWALRAAMAHLKGQYKEEGEFRSRALQHWPANPAVDYLIGRKLSQHYRFHEAVIYQRRALKVKPTFLPARFQLAQDLLRTGKDDEGWSIVDQVSATDRYNVVAFNLKTLQDRLSKFATLEAPGLVIRMDAREAKIYGDRVIALLTRAADVLSKKYDLKLTEPVTVEIFPQQSDFAIRTFGLPGGAGFLGVCFGKLITANSPASQGDSPSNWESVLWHEFCHVITLQKTNNRMPRWLSEGISVYEELEANPSWGQRINPLYKKMLQGEDFVPLSKLSGAFLQPKSPLHLQFAYFESSLAVRYLMERHGLPLMRQLLIDLGMGLPIDEAFSRRFGNLDVLDKDFADFVAKQATEFLPATELDQEAVPKRAEADGLKEFLKEHPTNYFAQRQLTTQLVAEKDWSAAKPAVQRLLELYPDDAETGGGLDLQARIARELGDSTMELNTLERLTELSSDHLPALLRLVQIYREQQAWNKLQQVASKLLAVQPLIATGHEAMIEAAEKLGHANLTLPALQALEQLEPLDPAGLHYRLASAHFAVGQYDAARHQVLLALEEAPRYHEALQLLLKIAQERRSDAYQSGASPAHTEGVPLRTTTPELDGQPPKPEQQPDAVRAGEQDGANR